MAITYTATITRLMRRTDGSFDHFHIEAVPVRVDRSGKWRVGMLPYSIPCAKVLPTEFEVRIAGRWRKVRQVRYADDRYPTLFVGRKWDGEITVHIAARGDVVWDY